MFDLKKNGLLTRKDFGLAFNEVKADPIAVTDLFNLVDSEGAGVIDYAEFAKTILQ